MAKRGLGRGLSALIPTAFKTELEVLTVEEVQINQISTSSNQPRKDFDQEALNELAQSIKQFGIMQPLVLRRMDDGYQLIAGERRLKAAKQAGLSSVPAVIKKSNDIESLQMALIENLQREDLNAIEEAQAYHYLVENCNLSQEQLAQKIGKSREAIANTIRLLQLSSDIQTLVEEGKISSGHARALLSFKEPAIQKKIALRIVESNLTVRQVENLAALTKQRKRKRSQPGSYQATALKLSSFLGTKVKVKEAGDKGQIEIIFKNEQELGRIFKLIVGE